MSEIDTSSDIDPNEATITEDTVTHMGRVVRIEARGETWSMNVIGNKATAIVGFHPEWAIEAVQRHQRFGVTKTSRKDFEQAQKEMFGIEDDD